MSEKPKVLFIGDLNKDLPEYKEFVNKFEPVFYEIPLTKEELIKDFMEKFQDIQAIYGAWLGFVLLGGFKNEILENAPKSLKVVSVCSVGYEPYDFKRMAEKGVVLTNVPSDGAAEPVADLALYMALAAFRHFPLFVNSFNREKLNTVQTRAELDSGRFDSDSGKVVLNKKSTYSFGEIVGGRQVLSPRGHNAVIVGFGNIGQMIGLKLSALGLNISYVKRTPLTLEQLSKLSYKAEYCKSLEDAAQTADLVVIACPGTPETYHMVNKDVIDKFSKPIRIINIGRGSVIHEQALVDGLKLGKVLFAGLDVYEEEPKVHPELYDRDDVMLAPHIGASTVDNFDYTAVMALKNIQNVLEGGDGISRVN